MDQPVTRIRNLGPAMAAAFEGAGITRADTLYRMGADAAYAALLAQGQRPHFMAFTALALGLQSRPVTDAAPAEKAALRARFDAIKTAARGLDTGQQMGRARLDAALAEIGVIERRVQPTSSSPEKK